MPITIDRVRSGDLITAEFMNALLTELQLLEDRITTLETGSGGVRITDFDPEDEQAVGQILTIIGSGFAFPPSDNTVTFDGTPATEFHAVSNTEQIRVTVPSISVPPEGSDVTIRVANTEGEASALYHVVPEDEDIPIITAVVRPDNGNEVTLLVIGDTAIIRGSNFSATPADNLVEFESLTTNMIEGDPPTIDSATENELQFIVSDLPSVPPSGVHVYRVYVTVGGQRGEFATPVPVRR